MRQWELAVVEEDHTYVYRFDTWDELVAKLSVFDGLAIEYCIFRTQKRNNK